jgi:phage recombination protein Bet
MSTALATLTSKLAARLDMGEDGRSLVETLKQTAFKGQVSDAQMTALLVVANQYGLNPWTKEIYAFPDKNNGIVPVVGVDGWARIINNHPQFDGMEFEQDDQSCTCVMYRKDRTRPVKVTEYMSECKRANAGPWQSHPRRMLRHKAMIQCARLAFGFGGIYDQEDAEAITEKDMGPAEVVSSRPAAPAALPNYADADLEKNLPIWTQAMLSGKKSAQDIIATVSTKYVLSDAQRQRIHDAARPQEPEVIEADPETGEIMQSMQSSEHDDFLCEMAQAEAQK